MWVVCYDLNLKQTWQVKWLSCYVCRWGGAEGHRCTKTIFAYTGQLPPDLLPCDAPVLAPEPAGRKPAKKPASAAPRKRPAAASVDSESALPAADSESALPAADSAQDRKLSSAGRVRKPRAKSLSCPEAKRVYSKTYHRVRAKHKLETSLSPDEIISEARLEGKKAVKAWLESE